MPKVTETHVSVSGSLWYCQECGKELKPIIMHPKPICASCFSPHTMKRVAPDLRKPSRRVNRPRGSFSKKASPPVVDPASGSVEFEDFVRKFAHQPRTPGLSRTPSATTPLDTDVEMIAAPPQVDMLLGEKSGGLENELEIPDLTTLAISRAMPVSNILDILIQHGCRDVAQDLDLSTCSEYPIANGGFGDIYRGQLINGTRVAIKCTRIIAGPVADEGQEHLTCAARELHTWSKLDHRYILKLFGLAQYRGQIAMVSPWVERGSLCRYLEGHPELNRPQLCMKIADGLAFLHSNHVIHGDLKGANVLVSDTEEPLIADFGNAIVQERTLQFTHSATKSGLSPRWTVTENWMRFYPRLADYRE
ncbi:hypothetical protein FS749_015871 [Ceratobasidium sp. UAMH 11750]|nr:hypothetical protein FS749_015871 [Ceratobasidium sp. UAMH 11750]